MNINLRKVCETPILAGAVNGRAALNRLLHEITDETRFPEIVFLDFSEIEVATASYLRECVIAFRDFVRSKRSNYYPVASNMNKIVKEELIETINNRSGAIVACVIHACEKISDVEIIGNLDPKQKMTFDLVCRHGDIDAGTLMRLYGEGEGLKHTTAWNNRLASLASLGLIIEASQGRSKRYRPLFKGM